VDQKTVRDHFAKWEGDSPYMYLDSTDHVTVGIGHLLADVEDAKALNFVYRKDQPEVKAGGKGPNKPAAKKGEQADAAAIAADYASVLTKAGQGYRAEAFEKLTVLDLPRDDRDSLFAADIAIFEAKLPRLFPDYATYPPSAQLALLDLIYNVGENGLKKFTSLGTAVKARDWNTASKNCHRKQISEERNKRTAELFVAAVQEEKAMNAIRKAIIEFIKVRPRFPTTGDLFIAIDSLIRPRSLPPR
jgi:GH24 family phage-related lysozyme (muramidase)